MMNLWGFEKQATLSKMADGRVGLRQTATPTQSVNATVNVFKRATGGAATPVTVPVTLHRYDSGTGDLQNAALDSQDIAAVIDQLRVNGQIHPNEFVEIQIHQVDDDQPAGPHIDRQIATNRIRVTPEMLRASEQRATSNTASSGSPTPPPPPNVTPPPAAGGQPAPANAPDPEIARQNNQARLDREARLEREAREDTLSRRQQEHEETMAARQLAAQQQQLPSAGAQFASATLNPIAGAFGGLANAAAIASLGMNNNVSAISTPFGSSYQASGLGAVGGGYGLGNPLLASLGGVGNYGGTALSNFGGGMDILGLGNTFYGQAMDERSRARQLDAEINRLKMMIMSGNMDAILQAVTLLTLRSKYTLRNAAATMITSMQNSNRQMEVQNNRLEGLSGNNTRSSQANQSEMMSINNQIQGINMDRQTAMNAVRDMMSALEEQTSTEQGIRRGFEQLRQISSWRA